MRSSERKYLKTINRIFGPAVEKAVPVVLKVAFVVAVIWFVVYMAINCRIGNRKPQLEPYGNR